MSKVRTIGTWTLTEKGLNDLYTGNLTDVCPEGPLVLEVMDLLGGRVDDRQILSRLDIHPRILRATLRGLVRQGRVDVVSLVPEV